MNVYVVFVTVVVDDRLHIGQRLTRDPPLEGEGMALGFGDCSVPDCLLQSVGLSPSGSKQQLCSCFTWRSLPSPESSSACTSRPPMPNSSASTPPQGKIEAFL